MLFLAGIVLNNALFGILFRPLKASPQRTASIEYSDACACYYFGFKRMNFNFFLVFFFLDQRDDICEMESVLNNHHLNGKPISNGTLINKNKENENKSLKESQKLLCNGTKNGTLSRPDIFYRVRNKFALNFKSSLIKCLIFFQIK